MTKRTRQKLSDVGEFGLIDLIRRQLFKRKDVVVGIGDDTAVLPYDTENYLLLTTDMVMEGVHFSSSTDALSIGHKAMACNISDIAAMGGKPTCAVVSLGIPSGKSLKFVQDIYKGMDKAGKKFSVAVVGGDTIKSNKVIVNIALLGKVKKTQLVLRSKAKVGDTIFVTGPLGRSLQTGKHICFTPRVVEADFVVKNFKPTAMIDISDGLAADLGHILEQSKVGAMVYDHLVPRNKGATLENALYDGEDFELIFTLSRKDALMVEKQSQFSFYPIGRILPQKAGLQLVNLKGQIRHLQPRGYRHF